MDHATSYTHCIQADEPKTPVMTPWELEHLDYQINQPPELANWKGTT